MRHAQRLSYLLLASLALYGKGERCTVTGTVNDATGAIVPGAGVSIRNLATNITMRADTKSEGLYYLPALPPGEYDVTAEKQGFRPARVSGLRLTVGLTATIDLTLEVGTVAEAVEVRASQVQLEAQTSGLGKVVDQRRVVELPLFRRNPLSLAATAPGVIPSYGQRGTGQDIVGESTTSPAAPNRAMPTPCRSRPWRNSKWRHRLIQPSSAGRPAVSSIWPPSPEPTNCTARRGSSCAMTT